MTLILLFFCFVFVFEHNFSAVQSDIRTNSTEHRKPNDSICSVSSSKHEQALAREAAWFLIDGAGRSHSGYGAVQLVLSRPACQGSFIVLDSEDLILH